MLYTMPGSPRVELQPLADLLARAPELPQAGRSRPPRPRPRRRGPARRCPSARRLYGLAGQPRRARPRAIRGDAVADALEPLIQPLLRDDQPVEAEALLNTPHRRAVRRGAHRLPAAHRLGLLSERPRPRGAPDRRPGPRRPDRICAPRRMGGRASPPGGWAIMRDGGRAFRHRRRPLDRQSSSPPPAIIGRRAPTPPAAIRSGSRRGSAPPRGSSETFYGLLAQSALGMRQPPAEHGDLHRRATGGRSASCRNVRAAIALAEIGETQLAADLIRHQARIGDPRDHEALIHLAARLNLTAHPDVPLAQRPARQPLRPGRALSDPGLAADPRLAGRPGSGLRPRAPGIATSGPRR